ncbi:MAG: hypothetical protein KatS3mg015_2190 [Fimbriimonadales bacterium]|nr:MAG: hypothetical protein KatS3mg015_2190 [Fimbriimonadales bacterium]
MTSGGVLKTVNLFWLALLLSGAANGARVYILENVAERPIPYDESIAVKDMTLGKFAEVGALDRWTSDVFSCFRRVRDGEKHIHDVRLMWSAGRSLLVVGRYGSWAKMIDTVTHQVLAQGTFDLIRFEQLIRGDRDLSGLLRRHAGLTFARWTQMAWFIVKNDLPRLARMRSAKITVRSLGASIEVEAGDVASGLLPDEEPASIELPLSVARASISHRFYLASAVPNELASGHLPPPGFTYVRVISVTGNIDPVVVPPAPVNAGQEGEAPSQPEYRPVAMLGAVSILIGAVSMMWRASKRWRAS